MCTLVSLSKELKNNYKVLFTPAYLIEATLWKSN